MDISIRTFDEFFENIILQSAILSIWGEVGVGKTSFSLQIAFNNALNGHDIIYIYTKPNFPFEKVSNFTQQSSNNILNKIKFIKSTDFEDLYHLVFNLEFIVTNEFKRQNHIIKLIVIDSITDLYRIKLNKEKKEKNFILNYKLNQLLATLSYLNEQHDVNILIVNDITYKQQDGKTKEIQSGGMVMDYWIDTSIKITRTDKLNYRRLVFKKRSTNEFYEYTSKLTSTGFKEFKR